MNYSQYDLDPDYEEYDDFPDDQVTSVGLPPSQLALIIGVNAVISLIISVAVVLIASRQIAPGTVAGLVQGGSTVSVPSSGQANPAGPPDAESATVALVPTQDSPLQSVTYEVKAGDTLSLIANKFNVSLFDLMTANGLTNQDFIQIGQELVIPIGGLPTATATFTPVPFPSETPLPFDPPTPLPEDAEIPREPAVTVGPSPTPTVTPTLLPTLTLPPLDEVNVNITQIIGPGDLPRETLIILNQGAGTSLEGWRLEGSSLANFTFPDLFLFSGGSIRIHTAAGQNTPSDLYLSQGEAAWPPGTTITLRDAEGNGISSFTVPPS